MKNQSVRAITDELDQFLTQVKEAQEGTTAESLKTPPKKEQDNLGVEQQEAAEASGSTMGKNVANTDVNEEDDHGIPKRDLDSKAEGNVDMNIKHESITMEQKAAQMERLGKGLINLLTKEAEAASGAIKKTAASKEAAEVVLPEGIDKEALEEMVATANKYAGEYFDQFMCGMIKRAQDEQALAEMNLDPKLLAEFGGVSGLLDKMAQEMPEAVLPPEVLEDAAVAAPAEAAPIETPVEGEPSPEEVEAIAAAMEQMGVTPEILEQAMGLIEELQGQGYTEEDIAQAAAEMIEEMAPEAVEAPVEEAPVEEDEASVQDQLQDKVAEYLARRK